MRFSRSSSGEIKEVTLSGHAGFDEEGKDIVCAAASTLLYTAIGALEDLCGFTDFYRIEEAVDDESIPFSEIRIPDAKEDKSHTAQTIVRVMEIGFKQLAQSAEGFVRLEE